jgi:hypothetical protein
MKAMARSTDLTARELRLWHACLKISEAVISQVARDVAEASEYSNASLKSVMDDFASVSWPLR